MKGKGILFVFWLILSVVLLASCFSNGRYEPVKGNGNVYPSENYRVAVTTDSNIHNFVIVENGGSKLTLTSKSGVNLNPTQLIFDVYLPNVKSVSIGGVGNITISAGSAFNLEIYFSGVGNIDTQNYQVQDITITHSGVGDATIWATNSIDGDFTGVGYIQYKGTPIINVNKTGLGDIRPLMGDIK